MSYLLPLSFFFTSVITFLVIYYKLPINYIQNGIIFLLLILLLISKKVLGADIKIKGSFKLIFLLITSLLVQLLVISTGAVYSPFLILIHIYGLGSSFLVSLSASTSFLICSIGIIIIATRLDPRLLSLFTDDPFSAILYGISFIVIIPIAYLVTRTYHIKETLSKILTTKLEIGEKREELILRGLQEIVVITSPDLKIISSSEALGKLFKKPQEKIIDKNLFEIIKLTDKTGSIVNEQNLPIVQILDNKVTQVIEDLRLIIEENVKSIPIIVKISPITDSSGNISQLTFVFSSPEVKNQTPHPSLEAAKNRNEQFLNSIKTTLSQMNFEELTAYLELYDHYQNDILIFQEIEDHGIILNPSLINVAYIVRKVILEEKNLADYFKIQMRFKIPEVETITQNSYFNLAETNVSSQSLPPNNFSVDLDGKWFKFLIQKLTDISIFLTTTDSRPEVTTTLNFEGNNIKFELSAKSKIKEAQLAKLFTEYYHHDLISMTGLKYSSCLEGYLANIISKQLKINLEVRFDKVLSAVVFKLIIPKRL